MSRHKHADLIKIAVDNWDVAEWRIWKGTEKAWSDWVRCKDEPTKWLEYVEYEVRIPPRTCFQKRVEVPEPMREAPASGASYFVADPATENLYKNFFWQGAYDDWRWLKRGLAYATAEDAIARAKAMLGVEG